MTTACPDGALVSLKDLIEAVEGQPDTISCYLDQSTGEIHAVSEEAFLIADDASTWNEIPEWQREEVEIAKRILGSDVYLTLPTAWDVHEWSIMRDFCATITDDRMRADCFSAIQGRGAFRCFKRELGHHGLWEAWDQFRRAAIRELVIEWCQQHGVAFAA